MTGDNYQLVAADSPASKKKVVALGLALVVPVLIWLVNGFLISYQVAQSSIGVALITAFVCGLVVFVIEKLIIMAKGSKVLTFIRVSIGLLVAVLGSIALDEIVFKDDIDRQMEGLKTAAIIEAKNTAEKNFKELNDYASLESRLRESEGLYNSAYTEVIAESNGNGGSKKPGVGDIARFKDKKSGERKADRDKLVDQKQRLDEEKAKAVSAAAEHRAQSYDTNALLERVKALFQLVGSDGYMCAIYVVFTLLLFFFEFLVVILKLTWSKTNYERKLEMIEQIGLNRMEFLQSMSSPLADPGNYLPHFGPARNGLSTKSSLFN